MIVRINVLKVPILEKQATCTTKRTHEHSIQVQYKSGKHGTDANN